LENELLESAFWGQLCWWSILGGVEMDFILVSEIGSDNATAETLGFSVIDFSHLGEFSVIFGLFDGDLYSSSTFLGVCGFTDEDCSFSKLLEDDQLMSNSLEESSFETFSTNISHFSSSNGLIAFGSFEFALKERSKRVLLFFFEFLGAESSQFITVPYLFVSFYSNKTFFKSFCLFSAF
jgi:hypothetical protein